MRSAKLSGNDLVNMSIKEKVNLKFEDEKDFRNYLSNVLLLLLSGKDELIYPYIPAIVNSVLANKNLVHVLMDVLCRRFCDKLEVLFLTIHDFFTVFELVHNLILAGIDDELVFELFNFLVNSTSSRYRFGTSELWGNKFKLIVEHFLSKENFKKETYDLCLKIGLFDKYWLMSSMLKDVNCLSTKVLSYIARVENEDIAKYKEHPNFIKFLFRIMFEAEKSYYYNVKMSSVLSSLGKDLFQKFMSEVKLEVKERDINKLSDRWYLIDKFILFLAGKIDGKFMRVGHRELASYVRDIIPYLTEQEFEKLTNTSFAWSTYGSVLLNNPAITKHKSLFKFLLKAWLNSSSLKTIQYKLCEPRILIDYEIVKKLGQKALCILLVRSYDFANKKLIRFKYSQDALDYIKLKGVVFASKGLLNLNVFKDFITCAESEIKNEMKVSKTR